MNVSLGKLRGEEADRQRLPRMNNRAVTCAKCLGLNDPGRIAVPRATSCFTYHERCARDLRSIHI